MTEYDDDYCDCCGGELIYDCWPCTICGGCTSCLTCYGDSGKHDEDITCRSCCDEPITADDIRTLATAMRQRRTT